MSQMPHDSNVLEFRFVDKDRRRVARLKGFPFVSDDNHWFSAAMASMLSVLVIPKRRIAFLEGSDKVVGLGHRFT